MNRRFLVVCLLLLPAFILSAGGTQEKKAGPVTLTLWYPAGEITVTSLPFRDGSFSILTIRPSIYSFSLTAFPVSVILIPLFSALLLLD